MFSRRTILAAGATVVTGSPGDATTARSNDLRFGIIADPQYADAPPNLAFNRYFANSLDKLRAAVATFNAEKPHFVATLGDVIDRDWASFDPIMQIYGTLSSPTAYVLGNHDFSVAPSELGSVAQRLGLKRSYYDFAAQGIRFVALDGNDVSVFAPPPGDPRRQLAADRLAALKASGANNANPWNGSLGDAQFYWLEQTLDKARLADERVIVLNHYPVFPDNSLNMWDSQRVVDLLVSQKHVVAYFCGHNHAGNYGDAGGLHFVNFAGMVDTPSDNAYAIVEIRDDQLAIKGFGREPNRSLTLRMR